MPVNVFTGWGCRTMPAQWAYYAKRHPDMTMVLLHMGTTDFGYGCVELVPQYENLMVETKIDDGVFIRNQQPLYRCKNLWYVPDGSMYVYYTPTHWREIL